LTAIWHEGSAPSIGVVTFNRDQADLIEQRLEERAEENAEFRAAYRRELARTEYGEDMGFFVKNVENVQGDERDQIIFSTTFGKKQVREVQAEFWEYWVRAGASAG
jgi:superfamily I DNA and/or RNA helicase